MGLLERFKGEPKPDADVARASLARDARAMEAALTGLQLDWVAATGETPELDLLAFVRDLLEGEIAAPTVDLRWLISQDTSPADFYSREIAPNWEGLDEDARAAKLTGFIDLAKSIDAEPAAVPREVAATVRTKTLILAWAFDEVYGYIGRLARPQDS